MNLSYRIEMHSK